MFLCIIQGLLAANNLTCLEYIFDCFRGTEFKWVSFLLRYGFNTPPNYNDHELYCGGYSRQWGTNGGKCGICGDPWDSKQVKNETFEPCVMVILLLYIMEKISKVIDIYFYKRLNFLVNIFEKF